MSREIKCPRALGKIELSPRNTHTDRRVQIEKTHLQSFNLAVVDQGVCLSGEQFKQLNKSAFELAGAYPYLFDVVNYLCTKQRHIIEHTDSSNSDTHYRVALPWRKLWDAAFDGFSDGNVNSFRRELRRMDKHPEKKIVPLSKNLSISTELIRVDIVYANTSTTQYSNLKNSEDRSPIGVFLEFYKPIWEPLFRGKDGGAWILTPKAFTAKIFHAIIRYRDLPKFKALGNFGTASNYRRLFLYMMMHDNKTGNKAHYNDIDLARSCLPSAIFVDDDGNFKLKSWYTLQRFFQKGMVLLNAMARDGFMESTGVIPKSVWYDKIARTITVGIHRGNLQVPELTHNYGAMRV